MDLSKLNIPDTISVHIEFPGVGKIYGDEEKKLATIIELFSPASDQAIAYTHKLQKKVLTKVAKRGLKGVSSTPEELDQQDIDRLMAFTASVSNLEYKGEMLNTKTIVELYSDPKMGWLTDQLKDRLGSWDDFLDQ
jgi:hypothetical protein